MRRSPLFGAKPLLFVLILTLIFMTGCGGGNSAKKTTDSTSASATSGGLSGSSTTTDPMGSLFGGSTSGTSGSAGSSGSTTGAATANPAESLKSLAGQLESLPTENAQQQSVLKNSVSWLQTQVQAYEGLDLGTSFSDLADFVRAQELERTRLAQLAEQARQAQLNSLAEQLEELSNRRDIYVAGKTMRNGGARHAFFRDPNLVAPHLPGYTFFGVMFQVYDRPQRIGQDVADLKLNGCAAPVTEDGAQAWLFFGGVGCAPGVVTLPDLGYISPRATSRTQRGLYFNVRFVDNNGNANSDYTNALEIPGDALQQYFTPFMVWQRFNIATSPFGFVP